jgi:hypothetical protein
MFDVYYCKDEEFAK